MTRIAHPKHLVSFNIFFSSRLILASFLTEYQKTKSQRILKGQKILF